MAVYPVQKRLFPACVESHNGSESLVSPPQGAPSTFLACEIIKVCWVFSKCEVKFSHLLNEWVGRHILLLLLLFFADPKSPRFSSECTTPTKFPRKHLSNWSQGKFLLASKPSTPGWKYSFLPLPTAGGMRWVRVETRGCLVETLERERAEKQTPKQKEQLHQQKESG